MTENNAAQLGLTDDQIEALAKKHICPHHDRLDAVLANRVPYQQTEQFRRVKALIGDALSTLRAEGVQAGDERTADVDLPWLRAYMHHQIASDSWVVTVDQARDFARVAILADRQRRAALASAPVADESPMAKMADALREKGRQEQQAYQDSRVQSTEWGPMPHGTEADLPASAPVAGEADNTDYIGLALELESAAKRVESQTVQRAIEAGAHGLRLAYSFRNAAPQASEAVRNAALEEAARQCEDIYSWRGAYSAGIIQESALKVCASAVRALKTQADKDGAVCSCPTGDGSLHHPCAVHPTGEVDGGDCAKGAVVPSEPLRVFSAGMWTYDGTGQAFSHNDLDAAAFVTYRDALSPTQPTEQGERDA